VRDEEIGTIRIDIPLLSGEAKMYLFVPKDEGEPWWSDLRRYVLSMASRSSVELEGDDGPEIVDVLVADGPSRDALKAFLETAPTPLRSEYRTLSRVLKILPKVESPIVIRFFKERIAGS
jgi:hypothetical protein